MKKILATTTLAFALTTASLFAAAPALAATSASTQTLTQAHTVSAVTPVNQGGWGVLFNKQGQSATVFTKSGTAYVTWSRTETSNAAGTWVVNVNPAAASTVNYTQTVKTAGLNKVLNLLQQKSKANQFAYNGKADLAQAVKVAVKGQTV